MSSAHAAQDPVLLSQIGSLTLELDELKVHKLAHQEQMKSQQEQLVAQQAHIT